MNIFIEAVGWVGTFLVVLAYFLVSSKKISASGRKYQLLNLLGAGAIAINVYHHRAWPSLALQLVWGLIAITSLLKARQKTL